MLGQIKISWPIPIGQRYKKLSTTSESKLNFPQAKGGFFIARQHLVDIDACSCHHLTKNYRKSHSNFGEGIIICSGFTESFSENKHRWKDSLTKKLGPFICPLVKIARAVIFKDRSVT